MGSALKFKHTNVPRQMGELARLKVVQGPDNGAIYVITATRATLGRGEENDIVILDLKASRLHAEILSNGTDWVIQDKGSANGILHNGKVTRNAKLTLQDTVTIGATTLEFTTSSVDTVFLVAPPRAQAQSSQPTPRFQSIPVASPAAPKNNSILIIAGVLLAIFVFYGDSNPGKKLDSKKAAANGAQDLEVFLPQAEYNKMAETMFKDGLREYFAGNYNRARVQFETVLQISPSHKLATLYLENCGKAIEDQVKHHLEHGKKAFDAGKLRDARAHYERVVRLLYKDRSNPAFIEAQDQIQMIQKVVAGEGKG